MELERDSIEKGFENTSWAWKFFTSFQEQIPGERDSGRNMKEGRPPLDLSYNSSWDRKLCDELLMELFLFSQKIVPCESKKNKGGKQECKSVFFFMK